MRSEYTTTDIGFGFKAPKSLPPSIEILRDDAAYQRAAERDQFAYRFDDEKVPAVDFEQDVVVIIERGDEGGMDVRPVVNHVSLEANVLSLDVGFARLPDAEDLDVQRRPYLYIRLPKEALAGAPEVKLRVDGHPVP